MAASPPPAPWPVLLMIRELGLGGTERQMSVLAQSLDRRWFAPHIGCFIDSGLRREELDRAGVPVVRFPVTSFRSVSAWTGARALRAYVRDRGIALVHAFDYPACLFAIPALWPFPPAAVISSQRFHRELVGSGTARLLRITDRMARLIVVNSLDVRRHMIEEQGVPADRLRLCYNGLDLNEFLPPAPDARPASAALTIGVVCGLRKEKGLPVLLRAFSEVRRQHPGTRLLIVGDGPVKEELVALAKELDLGGDCAFQPGTGRVVPWLHQIDIFVLPSLSEALSNSLIEAMACGCCAVASRVGGNPELIEDGKTGLLAEPGDASGLAARLRRLIEDPALRRALAERGTSSVRDRFSTDAAASCVGAVYREVIESSVY